MTFRAVIANQKGGVAKTTTTLTLARCFADLGYRTLIIDTDQQGACANLLDVKTEGRNLFAFLVKQYRFDDCVIKDISPKLDLLASDRETIKTEAIIKADNSALFTFESLFPTVEHLYDVILIDTAPSIQLLQNCALMYARQVLIPISMDIQSIQGAVASVSTSEFLTREAQNRFSTPNVIRPIGYLPVMIDRRFHVTESTLWGINELTRKTGIPTLPPIRTDGTVSRSRKAKQLCQDFDPNCKAVEDYRIVAQDLIRLYSEQFDHVQELVKTA